jgi:hypothetical protein
LPSIHLGAGDPGFNPQSHKKKHIKTKKLGSGGVAYLASVSTNLSTVKIKKLKALRRNKPSKRFVMIF